MEARVDILVREFAISSEYPSLPWIEDHFCRGSVQRRRLGCRPAWRRWCVSKFDDWLNVRLHSSHRYGFSPTQWFFFIPHLYLVKRTTWPDIRSHHPTPIEIAVIELVFMWFHRNGIPPMDCTHRCGRRCVSWGRNFGRISWNRSDRRRVVVPSGSTGGWPTSSCAESSCRTAYTASSLNANPKEDM